jgi:hypothetical protein
LAQPSMAGPGATLGSAALQLLVALPLSLGAGGWARCPLYWWPLLRDVGATAVVLGSLVAALWATQGAWVASPQQRAARCWPGDEPVCCHQEAQAAGPGGWAPARTGDLLWWEAALMLALYGAYLGALRRHHALKWAAERCARALGFLRAQQRDQLRRARHRRELELHEEREQARRLQLRAATSPSRSGTSKRKLRRWLDDDADRQHVLQLLAAPGAGAGTSRAVQRAAACIVLRLPSAPEALVALSAPRGRPSAASLQRWLLHEHAASDILGDAVLLGGVADESDPEAIGAAAAKVADALLLAFASAGSCGLASSSSGTSSSSKSKSSKSSKSSSSSSSFKSPSSRGKLTNTVPDSPAQCLPASFASSFAPGGAASEGGVRDTVLEVAPVPEPSPADEPDVEEGPSVAPGQFAAWFARHEALLLREVNAAFAWLDEGDCGEVSAGAAGAVLQLLGTRPRRRAVDRAREALEIAADARLGRSEFAQWYRASNGGAQRLSSGAAEAWPRTDGVPPDLGVLGMSEGWRKRDLLLQLPMLPLRALVWTTTRLWTGPARELGAWEGALWVAAAVLWLGALAAAVLAALRGLGAAFVPESALGSTLLAVGLNVPHLHSALLRAAATQSDAQREYGLVRELEQGVKGGLLDLGLGLPLAALIACLAHGHPVALVAPSLAPSALMLAVMALLVLALFTSARWELNAIVAAAMLLLYALWLVHDLLLADWYRPASSPVRCSGCIQDIVCAQLSS